MESGTQNHSQGGADTPTANLEHIRNALHATLDPRVPNDVRQQALQHLEAVKSQPDAPMNGYLLAADRSQDAAVRYYGLQLLEFGVRYRWLGYNEGQTIQLRDWVRSLAGDVHGQTDPLFVRNKIAQLWAEVAKRCWGTEPGEWAAMDNELVALWSTRKAAESSGKGQDVPGATVANELLVLYILEILSEDIMNSEDTIAGLRLDVLGPALNEVVISPDVYREHLATRGTSQAVRVDGPGWLGRICELFSDCVKQARMATGPVKELESCALKALNALRSMMGWITFQAVEEVNMVDCLFLPFYTSNIPLQTAAVEVLLALACRHSTLQRTWMGLIRQMLRADRAAIMRQAFEQAYTGPGEDDEKYTLQKKMAELLSVLADAVAQHHSIVDNTVDLPALYNFLLVVLQSKSLTVSIPALHSWTKQLAVQENDIVDLVLAALPSLLQTCSERLIRYEALSEDTDDLTLQFLGDDFDTVPERHAFLGNYRRYCNTVIQSIARSKPIDALSHVLGEMQSMLENGSYTISKGLNPASYSKTSLPSLKFDAQYNVVMSALKGYGAWTYDIAGLTASDPIHAKAEKDRQDATNALQQWCSGIVGVSVDDPVVTEQILAITAQILKILRQIPTNFVLEIVHRLLTMEVNSSQPQHTTFHDCVVAFEHARVIELQKLALSFPNELLGVYDDLESRVKSMMHKFQGDARLIWGYNAFLFMIVHRASALDQPIRMSRLEQMLKPVYETWTDPHLASSLSSLDAFNAALGLNDLPQFYEQNGFSRVQDWSAQQLDEAGRAKQADIKQRGDQLPLRMTKSMLAASCEKIKPGTDEYEAAVQLWSNLLPAVLPPLLQMLRHAAAFSNPTNWASSPPPIRAVVQRTLQDRFWQSGISSETKDEFYARITGSRTSYEGFASTIRGTVRTVREHSYHILYFLTKFAEPFYSLTELAEPLAEALFTDVASLGTNHLSPIINLATGLVQRCPPHYRRAFLPPLLNRMFISLDAKVSAEWDSVASTATKEGAAGGGQGEEDALGDEMRSESVLRQLTYSMVAFVPFLLEFEKPPPGSATNATNGQGDGGAQHNGSNGDQSAEHANRPLVCDIVFSEPTILEPLLVFCTHALRMRDARCVQTICRVFRSILPHFVARPATGGSPSPVPPEVAPQVADYICTDVLKACISSLHEPYFVDLQKDLANLITAILSLFSTQTNRPREVLLSLPGVESHRVDETLRDIRRMATPASDINGATASGGAAVGASNGPGAVHLSGSSSRLERAQRALVMLLLENVRGKSIHEVGRIGLSTTVPGPKKSSRKSATHQQYMEVQQQKPGIVEGDESGLDGVAGLFGDA